MKRIIAISGNGTGAGKTTYANRVGDQVYSIAGSMRAELQKRYPRYDWYRKDQDYKDTTVIHEVSRNATMRTVLTEYGQMVSEAKPTYWVDKLIGHMQEADRVADGVNTVAIDDVRKVEELGALKASFPGRVTHIHVVGVGAKAEEIFDNDELGAICDYWVEWT